jgi:hypothetical protein
MLVDVNGQICELIKAEAKGGSYHRRVPRKGGKGYTYYYDEDKYAASKNAHLDGPATRGARLTKAVLGAVEGAGKSGCAIKSLRDMAKKEGKEHIASAIKGCLEKGDLTYKKGMLYRKALKKAKLKIASEPSDKKVKGGKEDPQEKDAAEKQAGRGGKEQQEKPKKKVLKKAAISLYVHDPLYKAKGPIGRGKRGGKIYGYDSKGKPIYKPSEAPSKGAKKKPSKPEPQLSLFGQPKLEKPEPKVQEVVQPQAPKVIEPAAEATSEPKMMTAAEMKEYSRQATENQEIERQQRLAKEKERAEWAAAERLKTPEQREAELEALREQWRAVPRSGKGWQLVTKPLPEVRRKRWVEDTVAKIEKLPVGAKVRVRTLDGKTADWRVTEGGKVTLEGLAKEMPMAPKYALPEVGGAVNAQVEVSIPKDVKEAAAKRVAEEKAQKVEEPPQEGESGLPEIPPKPAAPLRIPKGEFKQEMRRRYDLDLTPQGDSYSVKDEIKDVGGIWARNEKKWLLPSREALDYIQALMAHKAIEQTEKVAQAATDGRVLSGKTWDARLAIKKAGGQWQGASKSWVLPDSSNTALLQDLIDTGGASAATPERVEEAAKLVRGLPEKAWQQFNDDQWPSREVFSQELSGYNMYAVVDTILELKAAAKGNK